MKTVIDPNLSSCTKDFSKICFYPKLPISNTSLNHFKILCKHSTVQIYFKYNHKCELGHSVPIIL